MYIYMYIYIYIYTLHNIHIIGTSPFRWDFGSVGVSKADTFCKELQGFYVSRKRQSLLRTRSSVL